MEIKKKIISSLILVSSLILSNPVKSQEPPVYVDADNIIKEKDKVIAVGNVVIKKGNQTLEADKVIYFPDRDFAEFEGNIKIKTEKFEGIATRGNWSFKTDEGELYDVKGVIDGDYYFYAQKLSKVKDRYYFNELKISKCPFDNYDWYISSDKGNLKENDYIYSYNTVFRFCKLPILYTPYFAYPTSPRKSGFLVPTISTNSYNDLVLRVPYFWVINRNSDATITLDYRNKQGIGTDIEYRRQLNKIDRLKWNIFYFKEKSNGSWWEGRDIGRLRNRWRVKLDTTFRYKNFNSFVNVDIPSDPYFYEDYGTLGSILSPISQRYISYTKSQLLAIYDGDLITTELNFDYLYDLTKPNNEETLQRLPEIRFYIKKHPLIKNSGFFVDFLSVNTNFYREKLVRGFRSDNRLTISHFSNLWKLSNVFEIKPRFIAYLNLNGSDGSINFNNDQKTRGVVEFTDTLKMVEYRNYGSFIHSIIPEIKLNYITQHSNTNIPKFDRNDFIPDKKDIDFTVHNTLDFKDDKFLRWSIGTGYASGGYYYVSDRKETGHWKPLKNDVYMSIDRYSFSNTLLYSFKTNQIDTALSTFSVAIFDWLNYSISHSYSNNSTNQITNSIYGKVKNWSYNLSILNNMKGGYTQQKRFSLLWNRGCWNLQFYYVEDFNRTTGKTFISYYFIVSILDIPYQLPFLSQSKGY